MNQKVKKAVIPAAGLGTRFLPVTKSIPKEMIPIIDKPMLHYIVEEAVNSGIQDVVLITARNKESIEQYFVYNYELEDRLMKSGKESLARDIKKIADSVNIIVIYQKEPLGLGHAVGCARSVVGKDPFAVLLGDDLIDTADGVEPCTKQLMNIYNQHQTSVVGVMEVAPEDVSKYGIVGGQTLASDSRTMKVTELVEKPKAGLAPSRFAIPGRYILDSEIFDHIQNTKPGANGEIQLTDSLLSLAKTKGLLAHKFSGDRYDTGDRLGYLDATLTFGLRRPELKEGLTALLKKHLKSLALAIGFSALLAATPAAQAYIPPASFIINRMVEDRSAVKKIEIVGKITNLRTGSKFDEIAQIDFTNEKVRVVIVSEAGKVIHRHETAMNKIAPLGLAWLVLGMDSNSERVKAVLQKLKVGVRSHDDLLLRRIGDRPVWQWGEPSSIQIEKDDFLLAGFILEKQSSFSVEQFTLEGAAVRFPKLIRFKSAGPVGASDLFSYEMKKYKTNAFSTLSTNAIPIDPLITDRGEEWIALVR